MKTNKIKVLVALSILVTMGFLTLTPVLATSDSSLADSGYPKYQADNQNTGQSSYTGPQNNSTKWNYTTGDTYSQITQAPSIGPDGTIYLPTNGGSSQGNLYALNPDGTKKWNYTITDGYQNKIIGSPAVTEDGTIYITDEFYDGTGSNARPYGVLYALNSDGTFKWKYIISDGRYVMMSGSPAVWTDGTIYFPSQYVASDGSRWYGNFYALNPDGTKKWNYTITDGVGSYIKGAAIATDGTIYLTSPFNTIGDMSNVYALNPDGTKKWNYTLPDGPNGNYIQGSPSIATDGTIYVVSFYNGAQTSGNLFALNPDGTFKWNYTITDGTYCNLFASPSIATDGTIYVGVYFIYGGSYRGNLYAFNSDGTKKWNFTTNEVITKEAIIGADGTIYFGDTNYYTVNALFYALNPDGTKKWSLMVWPTSAAAMGGDGTLYFGVQNGQTHTLYAIQGPESDPYINNIQSVTLNGQEASTNTVNAQTVGMQTTGAPIILLAIAILSVLGGLVTSRKKQ